MTKTSPKGDFLETNRTYRPLSETQIKTINQTMLYEMPCVTTSHIVLFGSDVMSYHVAKRAAAELKTLSHMPDIIICGGNPAQEDEASLALIPHAGVHPIKGETESSYMKRVLLEEGIPEHKIKTDDRSTNTQQNIENALELGLDTADSVTLYCPPYLQRRALMTYRRLNPEKARQPVRTVACYPEGTDIGAHNWHHITYTRFKMHEEAWKVGVIDYPPASHEDRDERNYLERGFVVPIDLSQEIKMLNALGAQKPQPHPS